MRRSVTVLVMAAVAMVLVAAMPHRGAFAAEDPASPEASSIGQVREGDPIFVRWLDPAVHSDQVLYGYWQRAEADAASATELVDLGTMLFLRGFPKDAIRVLRRAVKAAGEQEPSPDVVPADVLAAEAYFRIGLIQHGAGDRRAARRAYDNCLDVLTGHGWCNFYRARLEEQDGQPAKAIHYYQRAFTFAPALADPAVNPEVLYAELDLAALLPRLGSTRFVTSAPLSFLEPERVAQLLAELAPPPVAAATPTPIPGPVAPVVVAPEEVVPLAPTVVPEATAAPEPTPTPTPELTQAQQRRLDRLRQRQKMIERRGVAPSAPSEPEEPPTEEPPTYS